MQEDDKIPFLEHLEELRGRLIKSFTAVVVGFFACYAFKEKLFAILSRPLINVMNQGEKMVFTGLPEAFFTYLKVAFLAGIILASPVIIYQFWMFVTPGLYQKEKKLLVPIILLSILFFTGGALFGYFVVFPFGFQFFLGFASDNIQPMLSMKEFLTFATKVLLAFGICFELPIVITALARLGLVTVPFLKSSRKYALLGFFIMAAILTPPDVVTQVMMAMPMMVLYEISILGARLFGLPPEEDDSEEEESKEDVAEKETA